MKIITPIDLDLKYSNIPEDTTFSAWDSAVTYYTGDKVYYIHNGVKEIFESLIDSNQDIEPYGNPKEWRNLGGTERFKMFDSFTNTATESLDYIEVEINAGRCDACALLNLDAYSVTWTLFDESVDPRAEIKTETKDLQLTTSWRGLCKVGRSNYIGQSRFPVKTGLIDYSHRSEDDRGYSYLEPGYWTKDNDVDVQIPSRAVDMIYRKLAKLRGTPVIWDCNNDGVSHENLIIYGVFRHFDVILPGPIYSQCSINIEGLV